MKKQEKTLIHRPERPGGEGWHLVWHYERDAESDYPVMALYFSVTEAEAKRRMQKLAEADKKDGKNPTIVDESNEDAIKITRSDGDTISVAKSKSSTEKNKNNNSR